MHFIDLIIFIIYMVGMLAVGFYFLRKNQGTDDYYVGGRQMGSVHIGLSAVATDVGGGFSIGLGGLGFTIGLSGSWMLFTGLVGAWLAAVFLIPLVKGNPKFAKLLTFPQLFGHYYSARVAVVAAIISAVGYAGFTSSQLLAGAKLASGTFTELSLTHALIIMGVIAVVYTVMGGIKAVIYTDTVQWILLMGGLLFIGLPMAYNAVGGWETIRAAVAPEMLRLDHVSGVQLFNWGVTIVPIWFVGMTLYQRIYAARDVKTARKAWFIAGLFEWPIMAFLGVALGLMARVAAEQGMFAELGVLSGAEVDPESGLPMLLRTILPFGLMGLMMASYFSAILSTADSCLMAASGNIVTDLLSRWLGLDPGHPRMLRTAQIATLVLGAVALLLASLATNVLDLMLLSYAFMVSGLLVPLLGALYWKRSSPTGALLAMIGGGLTTSLLESFSVALPYDLNANAFGIAVATLLFVTGSYLFPNPSSKTTT
ncbi:MAG TPA: sodium:solute symporter [Cytophagales bacterium]|nr:sodium:solute symporter [Cytophagales bacterium]HAA20044.1 sodium:solute symporter [Cytophagales bacterium]HAP60109.1 sodium:solute symporter [Cytophagales bacterium]